MYVLRPIPPKARGAKRFAKFLKKLDDEKEGRKVFAVTTGKLIPGFSGGGNRNAKGRKGKRPATAGERGGFDPAFIEPLDSPILLVSRDKSTASQKRRRHATLQTLPSPHHTAVNN